MHALASGGPGSGWTPDELASCIAWYHTSDMVYDDGESAAWSDAIDDYNLTSPSAYGLDSPTYESGETDLINGEAVIRFNGTDQMLYNPAASLADADVQYTGEMFAVIKPNSPSSYTAIIGVCEDGNTDDTYLFGGTIDVDGANYSWFRAYVDGIKDQSIYGDTPLIDSEVYIISWSSDDSNHYIRVNGNEDTLTKVAGTDDDDGTWFSDILNMDTTCMCGLTAGAPAPTYFFAGDVAEAIVFKERLSSSDRDLVEQYLANKYDVELS